MAYRVSGGRRRVRLAIDRSRGIRYHSGVQKGMSRSGEIGRHATFRALCSNGHRGSSPLFGINPLQKSSHVSPELKFLLISTKIYGCLAVFLSLLLSEKGAGTVFRIVKNARHSRQTEERSPEKGFCTPLFSRTHHLPIQKSLSRKPSRLFIICLIT